MFYFHPYLGKIPILTNIFQLGWNHHLAWACFFNCFFQFFSLNGHFKRGWWPSSKLTWLAEKIHHFLIGETSSNCFCFCCHVSFRWRSIWAPSHSDIANEQMFGRITVANRTGIHKTDRSYAIRQQAAAFCFQHALEKPSPRIVLVIKWETIPLHVVETQMSSEEGPCGWFVRDYILWVVFLLKGC